MPYEKRVDIQDALFLVGPTASGKTAVGICLAEELRAEIVSLDSMAVYKGMDIGTAKPTAAERSRVRHHLIDMVEPWEDYSLARYLDDVQRVLTEIRSRRQRALFVGGTPLYLKALLRGMFEGPGADWEFREQLRAWANTHGPESLHARLISVDPEAAAKSTPTTCGGSFGRWRFTKRPASRSVTGNGSLIIRQKWQKAVCSSSIGPGTRFMSGSTGGWTRCLLKVSWRR